MRFVLIRHAQTVANEAGRWQGHTDTAITPMGGAQIECLARSLVLAREHYPTDWDRIVLYSSPLGRAWTTAQGIAEALSLSIHPEPDLREYDVGIFSGKTPDEIAIDHPGAAACFARHRDWDQVPDAEPLISRARRAERVLANLLSHHSDDETVICVTHGGFLQYLIAAVLNTPRVWGFRPGNTARFEFQFSQLATLEQADSSAALSTYRCRIERFNDTTHLDSLTLG